MCHCVCECLFPDMQHLSSDWKLQELYVPFSGPGSSVGIATDYGLDGPGSNPGGDEIFRPSGPALGLTADHSPPSSAAVMEE